MATTTTNFGWTIPQSTDLVKDGATAIATLGSNIDTSMVKLKGGTTGQVLSKNSNTDMDFTWVTDAGDISGVTAGTGISGGGTSGTVTITNSMATAIDAKGDLIAGTGADAFDRLAVGTNGQVLTADSTASTGMKWATASSTPTFVGCSVYSTAGVTIPNATATVVTWNSEYFDTDGYHSTSTNTGRITIPSGKAGKYLIIGAISCDPLGATGRHSAAVYKNGTIFAQTESTPGASTYPTINLSVIMDLAVGDYVDYRIYQTSGANLTVAQYAGEVFQCQWLGA